MSGTVHKILKPYQYLYDVVKAVIDGKKIPVDEFNLVGGRKSGKSVSVQVIFGMMLNLPIRIGLFGIRASVNGAKEFFMDTCETLEAFGIPFKANSTKLTISSGVNTMRFVGMDSNRTANKAQRSGLARVGNVKYIFKYYEERFEFTTANYQAMQEAIRGLDPNIQMVTFNVCNPWAKSSPYIKYCATFQEWDLNLLKQTGSQVGIYDYTDPETKITTRKLFHYTNWRAARDVLSPSEINEIRNTWNIDRNRAMTTDYGLPGYEFGAIYTHLLQKIGTPVYSTEPQYILAGMDYGWSQRDIGGKTACYFGTAAIDSGVDIYAEYMHDNAVHPKGVNIVAKEIVDFYIEAVSTFCERTNAIAPPIVKVRVDNMAVGVIQILNNVAREKGVSRWLQFIKCRKYPIQDRIELTLNLMGGHWLRIAPNCKNLLQEFELAHYEETETQKRAKENDHSLNAFEYAIEPIMYKFARELGLKDLSNKLGKETRVW